MECSIVSLKLFASLVDHDIILNILEFLLNSIFWVESFIVVSRSIESCSVVIEDALSVRLVYTVELFHVLLKLWMTFGLSRNPVCVSRVFLISAGLIKLIVINFTCILRVQTKEITHILLESILFLGWQVLECSVRIFLKSLMS